MVNPLNVLGVRRVRFLPKHFFQVDLKEQYTNTNLARLELSKLVSRIEENPSLQGRYCICVSGIQTAKEGSSEATYMSYYTIILGFEREEEAYLFMICR